MSQPGIAFNLKFQSAGKERRFLDRPAVLAALSPFEQRLLIRFGGFVRTFARRSIKPSLKTSPAGRPPSDHVGFYRAARNRANKKAGLEKEKGGGVRGEGLRFILFVYEKATHSVVIGPVGSEGSKVPGLMEYGGTTTLTRNGKQITATYRPRPFMGPAFRAGMEKLPSFILQSKAVQAA